MWQQTPNNDLTISLIQASPYWNQPHVNRAMFDALIEPLADKTDLIILPEMFTSGFTLDSNQAELGDDCAITCDWIKNRAITTNAAICGSVLYRDNSEQFNRLLFAAPKSELQHYDKTHLFRMAGEHDRYQAGTKRKVFLYKGWRILASVCYDLRFPVFLRNRADYDLMVCVANWPSARRNAWRSLLQARAIENLSFVAGVNRIGKDGKSLNYSGDSMVVDFKGDHLIDHPENQAFVETTTLRASKLAEFRKQFPAWQDADDFELTKF